MNKDQNKLARQNVKSHTGVKIKGQSPVDVAQEIQRREQLLQEGHTLEEAKKIILQERRPDSERVEKALGVTMKGKSMEEVMEALQEREGKLAKGASTLDLRKNRKSAKVENAIEIG